MFNLFFNNIINHFLTIATSAMASFVCNNNAVPTHISFAMCFFIISGLVAVISNLVVTNEIICIVIIAVVLMLSVNKKLNKLKILNKIMG